MTYEPKPINTTDVQLSEELLALTEYLAENAHEVWAKQRIAQGWTYGPQRDDAAKFHPDLVPYADLTDEEREFDRSTAMGTLKLIVKLGYRIAREE